MGHEHKIRCTSCKKLVRRASEGEKTVTFVCKCGKTTYTRSKGL